MVSLDIIILLLLSFVTTIIGFYLLYLFFHTKIFEFFTFACFFLFSGSMTYFFMNLANQYNVLIFYQLERIFFITGYIFLYHFLHRIKYEGKKQFHSIVIIGYVLLLITLIFFWKLDVQPENATVILLNLKHMGNAPYHPNGAGIMLNSDIIIYSTSFPLLNIIFTIYISIIGLYYFINVSPKHQTPRIMKAKKIWVIIFILHLFFYFLALFPLDFNIFIQLSMLVSLILILYIILFIPEGLILSHYQILSVYKLYDKLDLNNTEKTSKNLTVEQIFDYIKSIPQDLVQKTDNKTNR